jgi:hypothetical protein
VCCVVLYYHIAVLCVLCCILSWRIVLCDITLYCTVLYCIILQCIALHYNALHLIALHSTVKYRIISSSTMVISVVYYHTPVLL